MVQDAGQLQQFGMQFDPMLRRYYLCRENKAHELEEVVFRVMGVIGWCQLPPLRQLPKYVP
jgi:hypothetical protein